MAELWYYRVNDSSIKDYGTFQRWFFSYKMLMQWLRSTFHAYTRRGGCIREARAVFVSTFVTANMRHKTSNRRRVHDFEERQAIRVENASKWAEVEQWMMRLHVHRFAYAIRGHIGQASGWPKPVKWSFRAPDSILLSHLVPNTFMSHQQQRFFAINSWSVSHWRMRMWTKPFPSSARRTQRIRMMNHR